MFDFSWLWCTDCFGMWRYNEYLLVVRAVNNSDTNYTFQRTHLITQLEYKYPESRNHWDPTLYLGGCQRIITNNQADSTQHFNCIQLPHISRSLYHHDKTVSAFHSYLYSVHNWNIFIDNWKASGGPHGGVVDISPSQSPRWGCHLCQGSSRHKRDNVNKMWNYGNCCLKTSTSHLQSPAHQHHTFCGCFLSPSIRAAWCSLIHNKGLGNLLSIPLLHEWLLSSVQDFSFISICL